MVEFFPSLSPPLRPLPLIPSTVLTGRETGRKPGIGSPLDVLNLSQAQASAWRGGAGCPALGREAQGCS